MRRFRLLPVLLCAPFLGGCLTHNLSHVQEPGRAVAFPTAGTWVSMVYVARTDSGVIAIDLGWGEAARVLPKRLRALNATPAEVTDVFLTHSHRDHIAGWTAVRRARFHLSEAEVPLFTGLAPHADLPSRAGSKALGHSGPVPGEVAVRPFAADTFFTFGRDTVRAYLTPGHTAGSASYLFRGILFVGDAVARKPLPGYRGADPVFSLDTRRNRESLRSLFERVRPHEVRWVCNAHAKCSAPTDKFIRKVTR